MIEDAPSSYPPVMPKVQASASISKNQLLPITVAYSFCARMASGSSTWWQTIPAVLVGWEKSGGKAIASFRSGKISTDSSRKLISPPLFHALCILQENIKHTEHGSVCSSPKQETDTCAHFLKKKICYWMDRIWSLRLKSPEQETSKKIKMVL